MKIQFGILNKNRQKSSSALIKVGKQEIIFICKFVKQNVTLEKTLS